MSVFLPSQKIQKETNEETHLTTTSNDFVWVIALFSGLVLTDDIKISIYEVFRDLPGGLLFIYDEALAFMIPQLLTNESQIGVIKKAVNLLCDMKDELNH